VARNKDLQYYLGLNYDVIVKKHEDEGEIMYAAFTRELDKNTFYGVGETPQEAIKSLGDVKRELFPYYIEKGFEIAEPEEEEEGLPSGKFIVRTSPQIHSHLLKMAKRHRQSLNSYINFLFSQSYTMDWVKDNIEAAMRSTFNKDIWERDVSITQIYGKSRYAKEEAA